MKERILKAILPFLVRVLMLLTGATIRFSETGATAFTPRQKKGGRYIYSFWHSRILMSIFYYRHKGISCMVSAGRDGEYIARVMNRLGYVTVRGSSSRDGIKALILQKRQIESGADAAVTPDGPRGPKQICKGGVILLSKISGTPIVPYGFDATRKLTLKSWDNFIIPLPFSKGVFVYGEPISVPPDAGEALMEEKRKELEARMNELTLQAENLCHSRS